MHDEFYLITFKLCGNPENPRRFERRCIECVDLKAAIAAILELGAEGAETVEMFRARLV